jgi:hypothetical protein
LQEQLVKAETFASAVTNSSGSAGSAAVMPPPKAKPDGSKAKPDGSKAKPDGSTAKPDGSKAKPDGLKSSAGSDSKKVASTGSDSKKAAEARHSR